jgi:hypothetical protein
MKTENTIETSKRIINFYCWGLIILPIVIWFSHLIITNCYFGMINLEYITKNFIPPVQINFGVYLLASLVELLLCLLLFLSSSFVLKYKNSWRKILVITLIVSILFLFVSPLIYDMVFQSEQVRIRLAKNNNETAGISRVTIMVWSYIRSIILSVFFLVIIRKLTDKNVLPFFD